MKRILALAAVCALLLPGVVSAQTSKGAPLTGTWDCVSHGSTRGDMNFTLYLTQNEDNTVSGWVSAPIGSTDLTSATFKDKTLEIHVDTPQGNYTLNGKYKKSQLSGDWSIDTGLKGTWEAKKSSESVDPK